MPTSVPQPHRVWLLSGLRLALAALVLAAVGYQLVTGLRDRPGFSVVNFVSYFTILSNLAGAAALVLAAGHRTRPPRWLDRLRGAATFYLAATGVVYALLLADLPADLQITAEWVNTVLHRVAPVLLVLDWLLDPPRHRLRPADAALWLLPPLVWAGYTLLRGPIVDWYPYPFIDPRTDGYAAVAGTCLLIAAGMAALAGLLAWLGSWLAAHRFRPVTGG